MINVIESLLKTLSHTIYSMLSVIGVIFSKSFRVIVQTSSAHASRVFLLSNIYRFDKLNVRITLILLVIFPDEHLLE